MHLLLLTALTFLAPGDTVYYDSTDAKTLNKAKSTYVDYYTWPDRANGILLETGYSLPPRSKVRELAKTTLFKVNDYGIRKDTVKHGEQVLYKDGLLFKKRNYVMGKRQGVETLYNKKGEVARTQTFVSDMLKSEEIKDSSFVDSLDLNIVEVMPHAPYDYVAYFSKNVKYPKDARKARIEGVVYMSFRVSARGDIEDVHVVKGLFPSIDAEARRLIWNMPPWYPGTQAGVPVPVRIKIPLRFKLPS